MTRVGSLVASKNLIIYFTFEIILLQRNLSFGTSLFRGYFHSRDANSGLETGKMFVQALDMLPPLKGYLVTGDTFLGPESVR